MGGQEIGVVILAVVVFAFAISAMRRSIPLYLMTLVASLILVASLFTGVLSRLFWSSFDNNDSSELLSFGLFVWMPVFLITACVSFVFATKRKVR